MITIPIMAQNDQQNLGSLLDKPFSALARQSQRRIDAADTGRNIYVETVAWAAVDESMNKGAEKVMNRMQKSKNQEGFYGGEIIQ